jgi:hypothetical protein
MFEVNLILPFQHLERQITKTKVLMLCKETISRYQMARCLRRGSAAARLLRLWVRNPRGAWMSVVSVVCCQVEIPATS